MTRRFVALSPEAEREAHEVYNWYWDRNPDAGRRFEADYDAALNRLIEAPEQGPEIERGVRRLLLGRFPYALLYTLETERVLVVAVMHTRRRPGYWRERGR